MPRRRLTAAVLLVGTLLTASVHVHAQDVSTLELEWRAPSECPDAAAVRTRVSSLLGAESPTTRRSIRASAVISSREGLYELRLDVADENHENSRAFSSISCDSVTDGAALVLAYAIDPVRAAQHADEPPLAASEGVPATPRRPASESVARVSLTAERDYRHVNIHSAASSLRNQLSFGARLSLSNGALPSLAPGAILDVALQVSRLEFRLGAELTSPVSDYAPDQSALGASFSRNALVARVGYVARIDRTQFGPYLGFAVGSIRGEGEGVSNPAVAHVLWIAGVAGGMVALDVLPWLALEASIHLELPTSRTQFEIRGFAPLYRVAAVGLDAQFGISVRLP